MATSTASAILWPAAASVLCGSSSSNIHGRKRNRRATTIRCAGLTDLIGGDLFRPDLRRWLDDVERHKALAVYSPHEGGYEGRYLTRLRYQGYYFLDLTARGLGDPESTLTKNHRVCPVLSKAELQFLALLPTLRPKVKVIAECGNWRNFVWRPLKEIATL